MTNTENIGNVGGTEEDLGQAAAQSSSDAGAVVHGTVTGTAHVTTRSVDAIIPGVASPTILSLGRSEEPKVVPDTGLSECQGRPLRILDPEPFRAIKRALAAAVEEQKKRNERDPLEDKMEKLTEVVQAQAIQISALNSTVETLLITVDGLKKELLTMQRTAGGSEQQQNNIESFVRSGAGAVAVPFPNSHQEKQMLILVSEADTPSPSTSSSLGAGIAVNEGGTPVSLSPSDHQQEESMESIEFLADVSPIPTSAIHHEELYLNVTKGTSADSSDQSNPTTIPASVVPSDRHLGPLSLRQSDQVLRSLRSSATSVQGTSTNHHEMENSLAEEAAGSNQENKQYKGRRRFNYDHIKVIGSNPTVYQCGVCQKKFKSRTWRSQHDVCVNGLVHMRHKCKQCCRGFTNNTDYQRHLRTHSNAKPFCCSQCKKGFKDKQYLKQHVSHVHSGTKPHCCPHCDKSFSVKGSLQAHIRRHETAQPYLCEKCSDAFTTKQGLLKHQQKVHSSESM